MTVTDGEYYDEMFYCFEEGGTGSFISQNMGIGAGFGYEKDENGFVFEIGGAEAYSRMKITETDTDEHFRAKWENGDVTEEWSYLAPADAFGFYDNYSLCSMAVFYYGVYVSNTVPVDAFAEICDDGLIRIDIINSEDNGDISAVRATYFVDRYTARGTDGDGGAVDLTEFEDAWDMPYPVSFELMPDIKELDTLRENGEMLGFWYIGYAEPYMDDIGSWRELYRLIFDVTGMSMKVRWLNSIPSDCFVSSEGGQELYLLLPSDIHGCVTISERVFNETTGELEEGRELFRQEDHLRPVLLKCNRSEIMPDVLVRVTDSGGELLEWSPCISGMDGRVVTANDTQKAIRDFTDYDRLMHPDDMPEAMG